MIVLKFGGTSVESPERIKNIARIVKQYSNPNILIVVSALGGITSLLETCGNKALEKDEVYKELLRKMEQKHFVIVDELISAKERSRVAAYLKLIFNEADEILQSVWALGEFSPRTKARLLSIGERLSSFLVNESLNQLNLKSEWVDSRNLLVTDGDYLNGKILRYSSEEKVKKYFDKPYGIVVAGGFIARNQAGEDTVLGRGGSDLSASVFAGFLDAERVEIWTDVNGMLTANPSLVSSAFTIDELSYEEAMELSHFGAKVLFPPTVQPVMAKKIPIVIKNTLNPWHAGTLIHDKPKNTEKEKSYVRGFSSINEVSLLTISGSGMIGIPGIAANAFHALSKQNINVLFITQSSSEHTICFAVHQHEANDARICIDTAFDNEIARGVINLCESEEGLSILAMVGDRMKSEVGLAGKAFRMLGENGINLRAIAQGGTERNISMVINRLDLRKAINVLHDGFLLSKYKKVHLYITGAGNVGGTLMEQIRKQHAYIRENFSLDIRVVMLANSTKMLVNADGIDLENWKELLKESPVEMNNGAFVETIRELNLRNGIYIDNTASDSLLEIYPKMAEMNIHVVASNKHMASSEWEQFSNFMQVCRKRSVKFLYETNVAAGLPVIKTIEDLIATGDRITRIQAVLSGSLNYIFNALNSGIAFSQAVKEAGEKGLTEPDPFIDLSGTDVSRKLLILSRAAGFNASMEEIINQPVMNKPDGELVNTEALPKILKREDQRFAEMVAEAQLESHRWRFVGEMENGKSSTAIRKVDASSPLYHLDGKDNIVLVYSQRYPEQPLVIKGAGAGPEVTASGVFADIMRIANN